MENASKALIIAGAILISIILISIGILVVNAAGDVTDRASTTMDAQAVQVFNQQFSNYEDEEQRGSNVRTLLNIVSSSNSKNPDDLISVKYGTTEGSEAAKIDSIRQQINNSRRYKVTFTTGASGQYTNITIEAVGATSST